MHIKVFAVFLFLLAAIGSAKLSRKKVLSKSLSVLLITSISLIGSVSAFTFAPNAIVAVPINVINNQGIATNSPWQQLITVNSVAYNSFEASNLMNVEYAYANGVVIPSWLESNNSNTAIVTNYWVSMNQIQANAGETIYLEFGQTTSDLFSYPNIGEVCQLSGTNTIDNGNVIFLYYQNFCSSYLNGALPTGWNKINSATGVVTTFTTGNLQLTSNAPVLSFFNGIYENSPLSASTNGNTLDFYGTLPLSQGGQAGSAVGTSSQTSWQPTLCEYSVQNYNTGFAVGCLNGARSGGFVAETPSTPYVWTYTMSNSLGTGNYLQNYVPFAQSTASGSQASTYLEIETANSILPMSAYWIRTRSNPPGNTVMPTTSFGNIIKPLIANTITPASPLIYNKLESIELASNAVGGMSPYQYVWYSSTIGNPSCNSANTITTGSNTLSTITISPTTNSFYTYQVSDSESPNSIVCSSADTVNVIAISPTLTLKPSNTLLDVGQGETFTLGVNNGIGPFNSILFNLTAWAKMYVPYSLSSNVLVNSGGTNTITFTAKSANQVVLPAGKNVQAYVEVALKNVELNGTHNGFQYFLTVNGSNYTRWLSSNGQNFVAFYANGTVISSWIQGNEINATNTKNLNSSIFGVWLKLNNPIPGTSYGANPNNYTTGDNAINLTIYDSMLANNTNHPSCTGPDALVPNPSAPHGLYILSGASPGSFNSVQESYMMADKRICGVLFNTNWASVEPANNTYNFSYMNRACAPWANNGFECAFSFYSTLTTAGPGWVLNTTGVGSTVCSGNAYPYQWQPAWQNLYENAISNITAHYANNRSISYFNFGLSGDTVGYPIPYNTLDPCYQAFASNGYSVGNWMKLNTNIINLEGKLSKEYNKAFVIHLATVNGSDVYDTQLGSIAANDSVGVGDEGYAYSDGQFGYFSPSYSAKDGCVNDYCNIFNQYKGTGWFTLQPVAPSAPNNVSCGEGLLNLLQPFATFIGSQVQEDWQADYLLADLPGYRETWGYYPQCYAPANTPSLTYANYSAEFNQALNETADMEGWRNASSSASAKPFLPIQTTLNIYIGFAPKTTDLMSSSGNEGESPLLSLANTGSATSQDNGNSIFNFYLPFVGLSSLPAFISSNNINTWFASNALVIGNDTTQSCADLGLTTSNTFLPGNVLDIFGVNVLKSSTTGSGSWNQGWVGLGATSASRCNIIDGIHQSSIAYTLISNGITIGNNFGFTKAVSNPSVYSIIDDPTGNVMIYQNYAFQTGSSAPNALTTNTLAQAINLNYQNQLTGNTFIYWIDTRIEPPSNVMPTQRISPLVVLSSSAGNSITPGLLTQSPSTQTISYSLIATDTGTTPPFTVWNTMDSANSIVINTDPSTTLATCGSVFDTGQTCTMSIQPIGGTFPQNCELYNVTGSKQQGANVMVYSSSAPNSVSFTVNTVGSFSYNAICTDSASTPVTSNSAAVTLEVNASMIATAGYHLATLALDGNVIQTNSLSLVDSFQNIGQPPYSVTYYVFNQTNGNQILSFTLTNAIFTEVGFFGNQIGNTLIVTMPKTNNDIGNVLIIANTVDSATTPNTLSQRTYVNVTAYKVATTQTYMLIQNGTNLNLLPGQHQNLSSTSSFNIQTSVASQNNLVSGNFFIFRLINGSKYYLNGTLLAGNALVANYSSNSLVGKSYALPIGKYFVDWNSTGTANYTGFEINAIIDQTQAIQQTGSGGPGGLGGPTTSTTTIPAQSNQPPKNQSASGIEADIKYDIEYLAQTQFDLFYWVHYNGNSASINWVISRKLPIAIWLVIAFGIGAFLALIKKHPKVFAGSTILAGVFFMLFIVGSFIH